MFKKLLIIAVLIGGLFWVLPSVANAQENSQVQVEVKISYLDQNIWAGEVSIDGGEFDEKDSSQLQPTALDALIKASVGNFSVEIVESSYGFYVNSINGIIPQGWDGWLYMVNNDSPWVGMGKYTVSEGDRVNVYYSIWPWKLEANKNNPLVGEEVIFTAFHYDSDTKIWQPVPSTTIKIGDTEYQTDSQGQVKRVFDKAGSYEAYIIGEWGANSPSFTIAVTEVPPPPPSQKPPVTLEQLQEAAEKALAYLQANQADAGSIENAGVSAWAAMAFGAGGVYSETIKKDNFSLLDFLNTYKPVKVLDFARQILTVLASGGDPRNFGGQDLIAGLKGFYNNGQIGDLGLINDDVFGILALIAAGENPNQEIILNSLQYIIGNQQADGGFSYSANAPSGDVDDTAAAIQALMAAKKAGLSLDISSTVEAAKLFLKNSQNPNGGFPYQKGSEWGSDSNSASTAWAIQAIVALGEDPNQWKTEDGSTPYHFLLNLQNEDGSFPWMRGETGSNLMTAYVIPALLKKTWPIILPKVLDSPSLPTTAPIPTPISDSTLASSSPPIIPTISGEAPSSQVSSKVREPVSKPGTIRSNENQKREEKAQGGNKGDKKKKGGGKGKRSGKKFSPPIPLSEADKNFILLVFITSILAASYLSGSTVIKTVKMKPKGLT